MIKATRRAITPWFTKVECNYCHYRYKPRSQNPLVCPKCQRPFLATVVTEFQELREKFIKITEN